MSWLVGIAGAYVVLKWIIPLAFLLIVAVMAARWARSRNEAHTPTFSGTLPEERDYKDRYWPLEPGASSDRDAHIHVRERHE